MSTPAPDEGGGVLALSLDVSAVPAQPVGAGRYTIDLATALLARTDVALTLWSRRGDGARWAELGSRVGSGDRAPTVRASAPTRRPVRLVWEQLRLPALLGAGSLDVHHGPHYTMPERARLPLVVTVSCAVRGSTSIFARTITSPRSNGPATAGLTMLNPNGAP